MSKPLTKLLGHRGLALTLLLLPLATARTSPLNSSTSTATSAAATTPTAATPTPTAATTAATEAPTPTTTPTAATTSATSTASTASTTTTPAASATTLATLALAAAALPTESRSSPNILCTKDVNSSSRSVGGGKGGGGTALKEGRAYVFVHCVAHTPLMKASHIPLESRHLKLTSVQVSASFVIGADRDGVLNRGGLKSLDSA
ncbi:unnamed protein product [Closterium sp. NIES-54]